MYANSLSALYCCWSGGRRELTEEKHERETVLARARSRSLPSVVGNETTIPNPHIPLPPSLKAVIQIFMDWPPSWSPGFSSLSLRLGVVLPLCEIYEGLLLFWEKICYPWVKAMTSVALWPRKNYGLSKERCSCVIAFSLLWCSGWPNYNVISMLLNCFYRRWNEMKLLMTSWMRRIWQPCKVCIRLPSTLWSDTLLLFCPALQSEMVNSISRSGQEDLTQLCSRRIVSSLLDAFVLSAPVCSNLRWECLDLDGSDSPRLVGSLQGRLCVKEN